MPDQNGYPFDWELKKIEKWDIQKDGINGLLDLIEEISHWSDLCFVKKSGFTEFNRKKCFKLTLHTGGWSGNEDIIRALQKNSMFWILYWVKSIRGGHYYFEIREFPK